MTFTCMKFGPVIVNFDARVIPFPRQKGLSTVSARAGLIERNDRSQMP